MFIISNQIQDFFYGFHQAISTNRFQTTKNSKILVYIQNLKISFTTIFFTPNFITLEKADYFTVFNLFVIILVISFLLFERAYYLFVKQQIYGPFFRTRGKHYFHLVPQSQLTVVTAAAVIVKESPRSSVPSNTPWISESILDFAPLLTAVLTAELDKTQLAFFIVVIFFSVSIFWTFKKLYGVIKLVITQNGNWSFSLPDFFLMLIFAGFLLDFVSFLYLLSRSDIVIEQLNSSRLTIAQHWQLLILIPCKICIFLIARRSIRFIKYQTKWTIQQKKIASFLIFILSVVLCAFLSVPATKLVIGYLVGNEFLGTLLFDTLQIRRCLTAEQSQAIISVINDISLVEVAKTRPYILGELSTWMLEKKPFYLDIYQTKGSLVGKAVQLQDLSEKITALSAEYRYSLKRVLSIINTGWDFVINVWNYLHNLKNKDLTVFEKCQIGVGAGTLVYYLYWFWFWLDFTSLEAAISWFSDRSFWLTFVCLLIPTGYVLHKNHYFKKNAAKDTVDITEDTELVDYWKIFCHLCALLTMLLGF